MPCCLTQTKDCEYQTFCRHWLGPVCLQILCLDSAWPARSGGLAPTASPGLPGSRCENSPLNSANCGGLAPPQPRHTNDRKSQLRPRLVPPNVSVPELKYSQSVSAKYLAARVSQFRPGIFRVSWHEAGSGPGLVISVRCPLPRPRAQKNAAGERGESGSRGGLISDWT